MTALIRPARSTSANRSIMAGIGLALLVVLACVAAALAAVSNSPIIIGLFVGSLLGVFLLMVPRLAFWLCVVGALVVSGFVSLFLPGLLKITWLFSMLGLFLTFAALINAATHARGAVGTPAFVWIGLGLMGYALLSAPLVGSTAPELMAGAKRYFQLWGLMFAGAWLLRDTTDLRRIVKFLLVLAVLQLPLALYQRIVLVPLRVGMGHGVVPIDVVSGTFEASLDGGGNSSGMVLFLSIALAFVVSAWRERQIGAWWCLLLATLLAVPMGLGETKVVVVFMPLMLFVLFGRYVRTAPLASSMILVVGLACTALFFWIYGTYFGKSGLSLAGRLQQTIDYNFGDMGYYGAYSLNRTTVLSYWWAHHGLANPHELLFGHGLGSSYFVPSAFVQGHVARETGYIAIGLTAASTILWDLGCVGLTLMLAMLWSGWRTAGRLLAIAPSGWARSTVVAARVTVGLFFVMVFYADSMLNALSIQCLLMLCLGGLATASRVWGRPVPQSARRGTAPAPETMPAGAVNAA